MVDEKLVVTTRGWLILAAAVASFVCQYYIWKESKKRGELIFEMTPVFEQSPNFLPISFTVPIANKGDEDATNIRVVSNIFFYDHINDIISYFKTFDNRLPSISSKKAVAHRNQMDPIYLRQTPFMYAVIDVTYKAGDKEYSIREVCVWNPVVGSQWATIDYRDPLMATRLINEVKRLNR